MTSDMSKTYLVLIVLWALSMAYLAQRLDRGWIPHDEGSFAQSAERVLSGELPHRDFDEIYTGGHAVMNALAFRLLGINLLSMRYVLLLWFAVWVVAMMYVALHFGSPLRAGVLTLLAVAWSVPNYPAPAPILVQPVPGSDGLGVLAALYGDRASPLVGCGG